MKILIVGNLGYVGSILSKYLRAERPNSIIHGFDTAYFAHCLTGAERLPECSLDEQFYGDVRTIAKDMLQGYDAVVQLAAISNDPMGNQFEGVTMAVNQTSALNIARFAGEAGVKNFVFASSCSIYGIAQGAPRNESDPLNPITAYARSKIGTELGLQALGTEMIVTCLRFATACGMSDRLRLDLVLNDYVACALSVGEITVLSDGTPWRPLIDVADMARAMDWAIDRKTENGGRYLAVNAGSNRSNYQVKDLAEAVAAAIPGTRISINYSAPVDSRSYQADFSLYERLAPAHQPLLDLDQSVQNLISGLQRMNFNNKDFRESNLIRLVVLQDHINSERLSRDLEWRAFSR